MSTNSSPRMHSLIFAAVLVLAGCGQDLTATEHVEKAKDYLAKGDLSPALIELSNAVQKDPNSVEGRWLLAKVAADVGEGPRAEKEIRKAMELGLNRSSGQFTLVKSLLLQGELDRVLQESSVLAPDLSKADQAGILGLRGQAYVAQGQFDLAQQALEQALEIKPDSVPALVGMTALHGYQRQYDDARQWVDKALKADPGSPEAWSALGDIEMSKGHLDAAEKAFSQAIKHLPAASIAQIKRAQVRIQLKKYPGAAADINSLKNAGLKDHPLVNYVSGLNDFEQKRYQEALASFQASYAANPDHLPNRIYLATTQRILGNTEQALSHAQQIAAIAPRSLAVQGLLGSVMVSRAEYDSAKDVLQGILSQSPNDPQALGMMATVAMREGDSNKGLEYATRLVSLEPDSKPAQDLLMVAKLMHGEALDSSIEMAGVQAAAAGDNYTREFMAALAAFRDGKLKQALDNSRALQSRYPDKVDPPKLAAAIYLSAGQWDKGKAELEKALKIQPNEPSATINLAKVEAIKGNLPRAKELTQALVKRQPDNVEAVRILAAMETRLGNPAAALEVLEQGVRSSPDNLNLTAELAQAQLKSGRASNVVESTRKLTDAQYRQQPALLELRGKAQLMTGDSKGAEASFKKLTRITPNSASARFHHANALAARGDTVRARKELEQAIKLNPRYLPARIGEVKMRFQSNEIDQARKALAKLRQDFGDRIEVLAIEGWFALGTGDFVTAEQRLADALKKNPDSELVLLTTRAQWAQKKHEPAINTMRDWLKDHPNDVPVQMQLAEAYLSMKREADAEAAYALVVKVVPQYVPALNNLAWLNRDKAPKKAMEYAQQAYQLAPKDPFVLDTLGMLVLRSGDTGRAVTLLRDAVARSPNDAQIQVHLATALIQQGRTGEAKKLLETVIRKAANTPAAQEAQKLLGTLGKG